MIDNTPMILTNKQHAECHNRWWQWRRDFPDRVVIAKRLFDIAERSVLAFGPHLRDLQSGWLQVNPDMLHADVYGAYDPIDTLLEVLHFPAHNPPIVDRTKIIDCVRKLIVEHELYGAGSGYAERSVVMGWVIRQHDMLLGDVLEVA